MISTLFSIKKSRIFLAIIAILQIILTTNCSSKKHLLIGGIEVRLNYPLVLDDTVVYYDKKVQMYSYDSLRLFMLPYNYDKFEEDSLIESSIGYEYFVCYKSFYHKQKGISFYLDISDRTPKIFETDTIIKKYAFGNFPWHEAIKAFKLYASTKIKKDCIEDIYLPSTNLIEEDSLIFLYSKNYSKYDYSFSNVLDSAKNSKLIKIYYIYNEGFSEKYEKVLPKRRAIYEMKEVPSNNIKDQEKLFLKYRQILWNANKK